MEVHVKFQEVSTVAKRKEKCHNGMKISERNKLVKLNPAEKRFQVTYDCPNLCEFFKGAKFSLNFSNSSFVISSNLLHP